MTPKDIVQSFVKVTSTLNLKRKYQINSDCMNLVNLDNCCQSSTLRQAVYSPFIA